MGRKKSLGFIFVRYYGGTYIARFQGKTASCTGGRKLAAERVAEKVLGKKAYSLQVHLFGREEYYQVFTGVT